MLITGSASAAAAPRRVAASPSRWYWRCAAVGAIRIGCTSSCPKRVVEVSMADDVRQDAGGERQIAPRVLVPRQGDLVGCAAGHVVPGSFAQALLGQGLEVGDAHRVGQQRTRSGRWRVGGRGSTHRRLDVAASRRGSSRAQHRTAAAHAHVSRRGHRECGLAH